MAQVKAGRGSIIKIARRISGLIVCALVVMLLSVDTDARQQSSNSAKSNFRAPLPLPAHRQDSRRVPGLHH